MSTTPETTTAPVPPAAAGSTAPSYDLDDETRDALRVVRNLAGCSALDLDAPEWDCIQIVTERFALAVPSPGGVGPGVVPHPTERFRAR